MSRFFAPTIRLLRNAALASLLLGGTAAQAIDQDDLLPVDEAFALSAAAPARDTVAVRFAIAEGYYLYRHRTSVEVLDGGFTAAPLVLPAGDKHTDEFFGEVETYRDALEATLPGSADASATTLRLRVKYQGCADLGICYPPQAREITVALPPAPAGEASAALAPVTGLLSSGRSSGLLSTSTSGGDAGLTATGSAGLPLPDTEAYRLEAVTDGPDRIVVRFTIAPGYYLYRDKTTFAAQSERGAVVRPGEWPAARTHSDEYFGEQAVYYDEVLVPLEVVRTQSGADTLRLTVGFMGCQENGVCYPPLKRELAIDLADAPANADATAADGASSDTTSSGANRAADGIGLFAALGLALLGGLILNLMPCVLPILSLKALGLAGSGESVAKARSHALWYTAGVVLSFAALGGLALALREAGLALGWGFQLQQPAVVGGLALLMFSVGLSLSGVFNLGGGLANVGGALTQKSGPAGDFFTGVLAVVVAAPCTAPFMGAALAYAFAASPIVAIGVFVALGLGLALPFLAIGFVPGLAQRLPKPGAWMDTLKQMLAFPMYLTAVWLVWVLAKQRGADAVGWVLGGAVLLALGLWAWEQARFKSATMRAFAVGIAVLGVAALWPVQQLPSAREAAGADAATSAPSQPAADGSVPYSADALAALRAEGRVVFVNMTADWCVSCKANERAVLSTDAFAAARDGANAVYMKGDWTDVDPAITGYLQQYGAVGVPFYAVYPVGGGEPEILPNLLTTGIVETALAKAAAK
ncbi:protein-disulfide reductase DsbD [Silanimonas sp.]|uniref:protein-disulfide reductase DsbD family protein n=1 Tax=Silanimonas sp. TaxID=1929290 RepID=UPI0022C9165C|nr:protein-disulfide reductase DsbD [Silanimonas sp.]MCZ8167236.1 protein-disulfide reductase DsbD [Silanimonas sp.]